MIQNFLQGFTSPIRGFKIIVSSPKNIAYSIVPFLIGVAVIGLGYFAASEFLNDWVTSFTGDSQFLKEWGALKVVIDTLLVLISWILVSILNFLAGYLCILIVAGPFYALMVENIFAVELPDKKPRTQWRLVFNMFLLGLVKVLIFTLIGLACFVMAFIPPLNLVAPLVLVLLVAFDCTDYAFEVDFLSLRQRVRFLRAHFGQFLGLSFAILATGFVPGSFFVLLPVFICGATQMYIQLQNEPV